MKEPLELLMTRAVAVLVFTAVTALETVFVLFFFGEIALFSAMGGLAFLRLFSLIMLFNAMLFLFAMRYQASKGVTGGVCEGNCRDLKLQIQKNLQSKLKENK